MKYLYFTIIFVISICAGSSSSSKKVYTAIKVNPHSPTIDGRSTDSIWSKAANGSGFQQVDPVEGDLPSEETQFKICYDEKNLYVLIEASDSEPRKISAALSRRDNVENSDIVGILLDSYFDLRTAFEFSVNAAGVKFDGIISDDSRHHCNKNWDPVWEVATSINDTGWVAEMRIPFNQLRFAEKTHHTWGMEIYRYIHRKQEYSQWHLIPKDAPGFVSYFGQLNGISGIRTSRKMELLPYAVSKFHKFKSEEGNPFATGQRRSLDAGFDGKFGLSGNFTVDFAINPDFGQVEADPSEVNLSAFETFFEEKRPFFIEGKNIFQFPLGIGDGDFARETLFYSRRIGRSPHHEPDVGDSEFLKMKDQTSILAAAKLSGKTANGWSLGVLNAMTAKEKATIDLNGARREETIEPFTNYFIGRIQKDFNKGNTYFGGIVTATNRNIDATHLNFMNRSGYTGGFDFTHQWKDKTYFFDAKLACSHVRGSKESMIELQTASARYFQRPDAAHVSIDSSRTNLTGHGGTINMGKQGNGNWRYVVGGIWRSPEFELNDVGYLRRADQVMQFIWVGYRINNPIALFNRINLNFNQWNGWNFAGEKLMTGGNINGGAQFKNYWGFWTGINRQMDGLSSHALRGGPAILYEGGWNSWYNIFSDTRKKVQVKLTGFSYWNDDKISAMHRIGADFYFRPSDRINVTMTPFYVKNRDNLQFVDTIDKNGIDRYIFGKIEQKTFGLVLRLNICIMPDLTIQYYGQPFISSGKYQSFKRITEPRAARYEDRFHTFRGNEIMADHDAEIYYVDENSDGQYDYSFNFPDFNFRQLRSNLVLRWEYRPGSQIYLVWAQERTHDQVSADFGVGKDYRRLFNTHPENIFLIKVNRWFSI